MVKFERELFGRSRLWRASSASTRYYLLCLAIAAADSSTEGQSKRIGAIARLVVAFV